MPPAEQIVHQSPEGINNEPGLKIIAGNRLEDLAGHLALILGKNPLPPFQREIIVVQSLGMRRWLSLQLASMCGIWADSRFPFPNDIIHEAFRSFFPDMPGERIFDKDRITWRLVQLLPHKKGIEGFEFISQYIESHPGGAALYYIAREVADLFDQYLTYRPEMILEWDKGVDENWQAILWRELSRDLLYFHPPALRNRLFEITASWQGQKIPDFPTRLNIFAVSYLPPFHTEILVALSRIIPVTMYILSPTPEYWGDIRTPRESATMLRRLKKRDTDPDSLHLDNNRLIASLGRMGRDFHELLTDREVQADPVFNEPGNDSILHRLQQDLFSIRDISEKMIISADDIMRDTSVSMASCHGPLREVEALRDYLLHAFNCDTTLEPRDVLVMTPDLETYAPYISAVFSRDGETGIPFNLSDRHLRDESPMLNTLFSFLALPGRRRTSAEIMDIVDTDIVRKALSLEQGDIDLLRRWITDNRICWGIDEDDKTELGLPAFRANTWRHGLDRMLTGYAMPGNELFHGVLPYNLIEGSSLRVLGIFSSVIDLVSDFISGCRQERTPGEWASFLEGIFARFNFPEDENYPPVREALSLLKEVDNGAVCSSLISYELVCGFLRSAIGEKRSDRPFISGSVTFCAMLPMRSIPFRVICILGMNDGVFPRSGAASSFNLIARQPMPGDRSLRDEDRYLFLETLLSARDSLFITYTGQSIKDNSSIPPSVLVSELLDYLDDSYTVMSDEIPAGIKLRSMILVRHPLQSWSHGYFTGKNRLFTYSSVDYHALLSSREKRIPVPPFYNENPAPLQARDTVNTADLVSCLVHPARFFLNRRLGIYFQRKDETLADHEPFTLDDHSVYKLGTELSAGILEKDGNADAMLSLLSARGDLPHGALGEYYYRDLVSGVNEFVPRVKRFLEGTRKAAVPVDILLNNCRITGTLNGLSSDGLVFFRYAKLKAADCIRAWVNHLLLCCSRPEGCTYRTVHIGRDDSLVLGEVDNPSEKLADLIRIFFEAHNGPVYFIPAMSLEYARATGSKGDPLQKAQRIWEGDDYIQAEGADPYNSLLYRGIDPLCTAFERVSVETFGPMLEAVEKDKKP